MSPVDTRRSLIAETRKEEKAALSEYRDALGAVSSCDPLTVGYDACQERLRKASAALLAAREAHQRAMGGLSPVAPKED